MEDFELYGTVGAIVCCLDSLNYLTEEGALSRVFQLCNNYLEPGGLLMFDMNTEHKFRTVLANNIFTFDNEDIYYTWENDFSEEDKLCDFYLTFFVKMVKPMNDLMKFIQNAHIQTVRFALHFRKTDFV